MGWTAKIFMPPRRILIPIEVAVTDRVSLDHTKEFDSVASGTFRTGSESLLI